MTNSKENSAFHFFLYLVSFLALTFLATGIGAILFQMVNKFFPDVLRYGGRLFSQGAVKYGISSIIVAGPLYLYLMALLNKHLHKGNISEKSTVRKWLTYIILFIAAAVIIIDLVALIFNLLDGELVTRIILKILVVFAIAASIFGYYFWAIRKKDMVGKKYPADRISFYVLIVVMILALVGSFLIVDSPSMARDKKIDEQTTNDLSNVSGAVNSHYYQYDVLPESLDQLSADVYYLPKPNQQSNISYVKKSDTNYELCADFKASNIGSEEEYYEYVESWSHDSGRVCFNKSVDMLEFNKPMPVR